MWSGTDWYLVVLGQYNLVLIGIKWYLSGQKSAFMPVYTEKADIWLGVTGP